MLLSGLLDRELDGAMELVVTEHLVSCGACRSERELLEEMSRDLRAGATSPGEPPRWETVVRRLDAKRPALRRWRRLFADHPIASLAAASVALFLIVTGGIAGGRYLRPSRVLHSAIPGSGGISSELIGELVGLSSDPDLSSFGAVQAVDRLQIPRLRDRVSFSPLVPETLPGGYRFDRAWMITSDSCRVVCLRYRQGGKYLAMIQGPSGGTAICNMANPQCCLMGGLACKRVRIDRVDVVQTTRGSLALVVAVPTGEADVEALMASLAKQPFTPKDDVHRE